jgi:hypothetical protein
MKSRARLSFSAAVILAAAAPSVRGEALNESLFGFRAPFAVSGYAGSSPLADFPVLVRLAADSPAGFDYARCAPGGSDLRFADADGNLLPHEIDTWDATGESLVWVGVPVLTNGTAFAMYYGSDDPGAASPSNLWSLAGYAGVWHLSDGHDSTTNGLDGALVSGISAAADSRLGGALDFADAKISLGTTPNGDLADGFSIEAWCYPRRLADKIGSSKSGNALFGKNLAMSVRVQGAGIELTTPGVLDHSLANCSIVTNEWFHLGLTFMPNPATSGNKTVADQYKVYRDGLQKASLGASRIPDLADSSEMWLGGNQWSDQDFDGILDEFRLSYSIRSADWIKAAYDTAVAPASFAVPGAVEPLDPAAPHLGSVSVAAADGSFVVTTVVSANVPASIVCTIDGTDYPMTTADEALPMAYSAVVSDLPAGTHTASVQATATSGTIVSANCRSAFHAGALAVSKIADADEGTLTPGGFRIARADADATDLPSLSFDVAFSGDGLAAVVPPGIATATIPAGAAYADIEVAPVHAPDVETDTTLALAVSGSLVGAPSSGSLVVRNASYDPAVRYVASTGDDANHGGTPDQPKKTIGAAVASLANVVQARACTVHVAAGTYTLARETDDPISVAAPIRILGEGGTPEDVVVRRDARAGANSSAYRSWQDCSIFHLNHPDALVANLVMDYGSVNQKDKTAGNAWIGPNGGTISNCVVRNGTAYHPYAVSAGILVAGPGLVTHCIITNNVADGKIEASWSGSNLGSAVVLRGTGGRLENCLVRDNRSATSGSNDKTSPVCAEGSATIANCTIVENQGRACGGVYANGTGVTVRNCVIAGNADVGADTNNPNWMGTGAFVACATDDETAVDAGFAAGTLDAFFPRHADDAPLEVRYRTVPGSPLYDAGEDYEPMAAFDLSGRQPRRIGAAVDIGCYEDAYLSVEATGEPMVGLESFATDFVLGTELPADVSIVWSADASFADASTNTVAEGVTNGVYGASFGGLEPDMDYWWKLVADNGRIRVESRPASFHTPGAPTFGAVTEAVSGPAATFSVGVASLARDELGNGLRTYISVYYTTNGTDYVEKPLGYAAWAGTLVGSATLPNGDCAWYARAYADYGGRTLESRTGLRTFRVFHNETPPAGFHRLDATIAYEGEPAEDIPVLLRLSEEIEGFRYADVANNGKDFLFSDQDGNLLPFEIDTWNPAGESLVWVRVPVFADGTVIHLDYGASETDGTADAADVWRRYVGVWHLGATNAASAYGSYPNSTATAGIDGEKAKASVAGQAGRFGRSVKICNAMRQGAGYRLGGVFVPDAGENSPLDLGSTFMVSGWFKHEDQDYYYDKLFAKRNATNNEGSPSGAFSIEMGASSDSRVTVAGNGGNTGAGTLASSLRNAWSHLVFVFDGRTCIIYQDGAPCKTNTINSASNNDAPLCFGNTTGGYGDGTGGAAWCGWMDEVRLADGVPTAAWLAAEHAAMAPGTNVVRFAAVRDLQMPVLDGAPELAWNVSSFRYAATVAYGLGDVLLTTVDLYDGSATTNATHSFDSQEQLPQSFSDDVALGENRMYRAVAVLRSSDGTEEDLAAADRMVYSGQLTATWIQDANIASMAPAIVRLSRAETAAATCADLTVSVEISGEAVAKGLLESVVSATIPAGTNCVDVAIRPIARSVVPGDYTATLAVTGSNVANPDGTRVEFGVLNAGADPYVRFVAPNGSDENDGALATSPKRTIAGALASFSDSARSALCTVHVAPGFYVVSSTMYLTNAVHILGDDPDPSRVVISNNVGANWTSGTHRIFTLTHPDALVANLTMQKGSVWGDWNSGGNFFVGTAGGTVSNCVVEAGAQVAGHGGAGGGYLEGGLVTHSVFRKNETTDSSPYSSGGGNKGAVLELNGSGRAENCLIVDNPQWAAVVLVKIGGSSAMRNCTIADSVLSRTNEVCKAFSPLRIDSSAATAQNVAIAGVTNKIDGTPCPPTGYVSRFRNGAFDGDASSLPAETVVGASSSFFLHPARGDYRPKSGGPLINAGVNYEPMAGVDLTGVQPRKVGSRVDIGCYEGFAETTILILR